MPTAAQQHERLVTLDAWLSERAPLDSREAVRLIQRLALQLAALHDQGRLHGHVTLQAVGVRADRSPILNTAGEVDAKIRLEGDLLPPELKQRGCLVISPDLATVTAALSQPGEPCDARRIDVYQLGALAVRLAVGASVEDYLVRPAISGRAPAALRRVLDRALGFSPIQRLTNARQFLDELQDWSQTPSSPRQETPSRGVAVNGSDTDINGTDDHVPRPAPSPELPFTQLGQYEIVARLGSGGMGDVYKGYDAALGRYVAIKVLPAELARSEDFVTRFRHEAAAAARVEHPCIVPIYTIGVDQGRHFFAMQFVDGRTLGQHLEHEPRPAVDWTLRVLVQVLEGLGAAHRHGLVHRDIKPANVLLADSGRRALLADFGLVKTASQETRMTATGVIMGTVDYISPEQGRGKPVDQRSDLYSIGVLMYQMLADRLPFHADTPTAMIFQHAYEAPPPLASVAPEVSPDLTRIVHRLLAKSPLDRYQTCEELLDDLQAIRSGQTPPHLIAASAAAGIRHTAVIVAPQFAEEKAAGAEEAAVAAEQSWYERWERWYGRLLLWLGRRAPELVRHLQNTQQQVDVAVLDYEDRCASLRRLVEEGEDVERVLAAQVVEHQQAARDAQRKADEATDEDAARDAVWDRQQNEETAAELNRQLAAQREELAQMQLALAKAIAKLARLRGQRDALNARLKLAQARYGLLDARPRRRFWPRVVMAAALGIGCIAVIAFGWRLSRGPQSAVVSSSAGKEDGASDVAEPPGMRPKSVPLTLDPAAQQTTIPVAIRSMTWMNIRASGDIFYLVLGGEDGSLWECYVRNGKLPPKADRYAAHTGATNGLAYSRQSQRLASAGADGEVLIWEERLGRISRRLSHGSSVDAISFSPLGDQLLAGTQHGVHSWEVVSGNELDRYAEQNGFNSVSRAGLAWLPDQSGFVQAANGSGGQMSTAAVVSMDGEERTPVTGAITRLQDLGIFRGGQMIVAVTDGGVTVWDQRSQTPARQFGEDVSCAAYSEHGLHTLTGHRDGTVKLWNTMTGEKIHDVVKDLPAAVRAVSMTQRGELGAAACGNNSVTLRIFPLSPEKVPGLTKSYYTPVPIRTLSFAPYAKDVVSLDQHQVRVWALEADLPPTTPVEGVVSGACAVFAPDGKHLLLARSQPNRDGFGPITLALLRQGPVPGNAQYRRYRGHPRGTNVATFIENGNKIVSGGNDNHIRIWDKEKETEISAFDFGMPVRALAVTGDGHRALVAGDRIDVQVWNLATGESAGTLKGHSLPPSAVAVAHDRDANRAVTISSDRTARVWDLKTLQGLATFTLDSMPTAVAITSNGAHVVIGSKDGVVRVWNVAKQSAGPIVGSHNGAVTALTLSVHDSSIVSAGEDQVLCWWFFPKDDNK